MRTTSVTIMIFFSKVPFWNYLISYVQLCSSYVQSSQAGVLRKRFSENMHRIYRRTPMPKCDLNKVAKQLYWNHTSEWVFSYKFAAYFQNAFFKEHLWVAASENRYQLDGGLVKKLFLRSVAVICGVGGLSHCINSKNSYMLLISLNRCSNMFFVEICLTLEHSENRYLIMDGGIFC